LKIVLYGAAGKAGSVILKELVESVDRGHIVFGAVRTPEEAQNRKRFQGARQDTLV
jgi:putative NADH-flavin reductase